MDYCPKKNGRLRQRPDVTCHMSACLIDVLISDLVLRSTVCISMHGVSDRKGNMINLFSYYETSYEVTGNGGF